MRDQSFYLCQLSPMQCIARFWSKHSWSLCKQKETSQLQNQPRQQEPNWIYILKISDIFFIMNWSLQDTVMKSAYLATQKLLELQKAQVSGITDQTENQTENLPEGSMKFSQFEKYS